MPYKPTLSEVDTAGNLNHLVDKTIGNAYAVVREVYKNLPFLKFLADRVDGVSPIEFRDNAELERVEWKYMADQPDDWKVLITYTSLTALAQQYKEETLVLRNEVSDLKDATQVIHDETAEIKDGTQALVDALLVELENNFNEDFAAFMLTAEAVRDVAIAQAGIATDKAVEAAEQVVLAADQVSLAAIQVGLAEDQVALAAIEKTAAQAARTGAEAARDAAFVNADVYADVATGLAAVADGEQFQVVSGDEIIRYRRDAGPVAVEVARYPAAELANKLNRGSKSSVILLLPLYPVPEGYTLSGSELFGLRVAYRSDAEGLLADSFTLGENGFAISAGGFGLLNEVGGIAEVDDPVLSIRDLSPNNYTIAAPAEANAPLLKDDAGAKYLQFDGVDDRLDIPNAAVDRETFTFACSVALTANGVFPTVLGDSSTSNGVFCGFESNNRRPRIAIAGGTAGLITATSASAIPLSTRTTIVYMYDGANLTIHVNGSLVATVAASGTAGAGVAARLCYSGGVISSFINLYNCILLDRAVDSTERAVLESLVESDPMPTAPYDGALIDSAIAEAYETLVSEVAAALPVFAVTDGVLIEKTKAYAVGDSTVAAYAGGTAIITLVDSPRIDVNVAVPGHTIAQQKTAWLALDVSKLLTGWVIVQIGLNDLNPAEEAAPAIARLQDLINTIRADIGEYRPLLISKMIPCKQRLIDLYGETNGPIAQAKWEDINDAIAGIGPTPITGVDYRITAHVPLMDDGAGNLKPEFDTGDGIHPNTAGRQVNATAWVNALADLGIPL